MEYMKEWKQRSQTLFEFADGFIKELRVSDMAVLKFCLISLGIMVGICLPKKAKRPLLFLSLLLFLVSFLFLAAKWGIYIGKACRERGESPCL